MRVVACQNKTGITQNFLGLLKTILQSLNTQGLYTAKNINLDDDPRDGFEQKPKEIELLLSRAIVATIEA